MRGLHFGNELSFRDDLPDPEPTAEEAVISTLLAGVCNTDLELVKGYMNFSGVLGHEFVGLVSETSDSRWAGKRVVGEINCYPVEDPRHHPQRTVLGIVNRDGTMADKFRLPTRNLLEVPEEMPDEVAVFTEPVAAGFNVLEQVPVEGKAVAVLGDGKLSAMTAQVVATAAGSVLVVGKYPHKLQPLADLGLQTMLLEDFEKDTTRYDVVVDATGRAQGVASAVPKVKPRGTLVLKTTVASETRLNWAPLVVDEIKVVGSRCGRFEPALRALQSGAVQVRPWIEEVYALDRGLEAFEHAARPGAKKVLLKP